MPTPLGVEAAEAAGQEEEKRIVNRTHSRATTRALKSLKPLQTKTRTRR